MAELERTREFLPNDIQPTIAERQKQIDDRLEELKRRKEKFDAEKEFVGIRRLGDSYTPAEAFAFIDGPSRQQLFYNEVTYAGIAGVGGFISVTLASRIFRASHLTSLIRGLIATVPCGLIAHQLYKWRLNSGKKREQLFFYYALMHENDFPKTERKKFGEIIRDYQTHRSLNIPAKYMTGSLKFRPEKQPELY